MLVIVGHGPSMVGRGLGDLIDAHPTVRLKQAPRPDRSDWGSRTDYVCATHLDFRREWRGEFWLFNHRGISRHKPVPMDGVRIADTDRWLDYFARFDPHYKPSTGLCAVFCAIEFMAPERIGLAGFDSWFRPELETYKWHHPIGRYRWPHDKLAEALALRGLGVEIVNLCED